MVSKRSQRIRKWLKNYLLLGGIVLIGVPFWEFLMEEYAFQEIDLFFPGQSDLIIGVMHIVVLAIFHFVSKKFDPKQGNPQR